MRTFKDIEIDFEKMSISEFIEYVLIERQHNAHIRSTFYKKLDEAIKWVKSGNNK